MKQLSITAAAFAATAMIALSPTDAGAADLEGKRVEFIVPFSEGGGGGSWARFLTPFMDRHLGTTTQLRYIPGGGSTKGANLYASRARPTGLELFSTSGSTQFAYLLDDKRVQYDYKDWRPLLAYATGGVVYISPDLGMKDAVEMVQKNPSLTFGGQTATGLDIVPLLAFELLGLDVKTVFGFTGRGPTRKSFMTGETNIDYQTSAAYISQVTPLVEEGTAQPVMTWGSLDDDGNLVRDPSFPDIPHFAEVYEKAKGEKPSGPGFEAWKAFFTAGFSAQKFILVPKETPEDVVEAYFAGFEQVFQDPEYIATKDQMIGKYPQVTGVQAVAKYKAGTDVPEESKVWVKNWLTEKFDVKF